MQNYLSVFNFKDKQTGSIIYYTPNLHISGYGSNNSEAFEMFMFGMKQVFKELKLK